MKYIKSFFEIIRKPWMAFIAMALGVVIGIAAKPLSVSIAPFGKMYLYFIQMTVIPIIITAIVTSVAQIIRSNIAKDVLIRIIAVMLCLFFLSGSVGVFTGLVARPGTHIDREKQNSIGRLVNQSKYLPDSEIYYFQPNIPPKKTDIADFFISIIPSNIFQSMSSGRALEVLFFSIMLGIAVGYLKNEAMVNTVMLSFRGLYEAFQKIMQWSMNLLFFAIICLISKQVSEIGPDVLFTMIHFVLTTLVMGLIVIFIDTLIIWKKSKAGYFQSIKALQKPLILGFASGSSIVALPSSIEAMSTNLKFDKDLVNLVLPLSITLGRFGQIAYFGVAALFAAQMYNIPLGAGEIIMLCIASVLAGIATTGNIGIGNLALFSIVLDFIGLPAEAILAILISVDPVMAPIRLLIVLFTNYAGAAIIAKAPAEAADYDPAQSMSRRASDAPAWK
jgi:proton glutamate symport protein